MMFYETYYIRTVLYELQ